MKKQIVKATYKGHKTQPKRFLMGPRHVDRNYLLLEPNSLQKQVQ